MTEDEPFIWTSADGTRWSLPSMTDRHLINTYRFCLRQVEDGNRAVSGAWQFAASLTGEQASYEIDREIDNMTDALRAFEEAANRFKAEIARRGLDS